VSPGVDERFDLLDPVAELVQLFHVWLAIVPNQASASFVGNESEIPAASTRLALCRQFQPFASRE
jgi:hypothetical protein